LADRQEQSDMAARVAGLLAAAARGREEPAAADAAWRELIALYGRRVYAIARSRCRRDDLAEEVTQSVFATVATKLAEAGYIEQGRFEAWLFRIAMNRVRDELRRMRRHAEVCDPEVFNRRAAEDVDAAEKDDVEQLKEAIVKLSEADRQIIELRHHAQMSFREMAEVLEEPLGTLLARHHRALRKLKKLMEGEREVASGQHGRTAK
jgi:RNA polymerase sigma-70 factor, ECF subfamily